MMRNYRTQRSLKLVLAGLALLAGAGPAAQLSGQQVLDSLKRATTARDRRATATMTVTDKSGRSQTRILRMAMKGDDRLMMTFREPQDLKGVTFLVNSKDNMWIYLPSQARVRRVSGSMVDQGFGGSDFSYRELSNLSFADQSQVLEMRDTAVSGTAAWRLLVQGSNKEKSRLVVEKARFIPLALEKLDTGGRPTKQVSFGDYENQGGVWIPRLIQMRDLDRASRTELKLTELELNPGLKDNFFTEANMKRGV